MMPGPGQIEQLMAQREQAELVMIRQQMADRRRVLEWAAILCSCEWRFVAGRPSSADCMVHGVFVMHPDGTIL